MSRSRTVKALCRALGHQGTETPVTDPQGRVWMVCTACDNRRELR